jgi:hypothetical protein
MTLKTILIRVSISIIVGMAALRFGYMFKNDRLSIITQILGYIIISYPFYLFFKGFILKIVKDVKKLKQEKEFYSNTGALYGIIQVGTDPLSNVKLIIKNTDGSLHKWTHKWIGHSDSDGVYDIRHLEDGEYSCEYSKTFSTGSMMIECFHFEIKEGTQVCHNIYIEKNNNRND